MWRELMVDERVNKVWQRFRGPNPAILDEGYQSAFCDLQEETRKKLVAGMTRRVFNINDVSACEDLSPEFEKNPALLETLVMVHNQDALALDARYLPATTLQPPVYSGPKLCFDVTSGWGNFNHRETRKCEKGSAGYALLHFIDSATPIRSMQRFSVTGAGFVVDNPVDVVRKLKTKYKFGEDDWVMWTQDGGEIWADPQKFDFDVNIEK